MPLDACKASSNLINHPTTDSRIFQARICEIASVYAGVIEHVFCNSGSTPRRRSRKAHVRYPGTWVVKAAVSLCKRLIRGYPCPEANLANPDELVVFMTLPVGVDELIIPGVLASRDIPVHLTERYFARQGRYVEIRVPALRLEDARRALDDAKRVGENLDSGTEV